MIKFASPDAQVSPQVTKPFQMVSGQNSRMAGSVPVWESIDSFAENLAEENQSAGKDNSFGFSDIVDMVNPLQHIPVVNNFYRSMTGDTIGAIAQIIGGAIFGGPVGALASAGMVAYQAAKTTVAEPNPMASVQDEIGSIADLRQGYTSYNH